MKLGYDLAIEQSLTQKPTMTPELIQAIRILQFTSQELDEYVQNEIIENPVLDFASQEGSGMSETEEGVSGSEEKDTVESEFGLNGTSEPDFDLREKIIEADYDDISYRQWEHRISGDDMVSFDQYTSEEETLEDYLLMQLSFTRLRDKEKKIARYLIEAIDENGYLTVETDKVAELYHVKTELIEKVLDVIQTFEPYGVGARSLEECLLIQLAARGLLEDSVEYIILHHLQDLADNRIQYVSRTSGLSVPHVQMIVDLIRSMEPKPGRCYSSGERVKYVIPDIIVEKEAEGYSVMTNDATIPHLMVSSYYMDLAKNHKENDDVRKYLSDKYNSAIWLIKSIEQRKQTIYNVACAVVDHQIAFFDKGDKYLRTMTLKQIADVVGVHESTISRSINGKYIQTPRGVFEIKYFFSSGVSNSEGDGLSSNSIKRFIREIIEDEDPKKPYSDQDMVTILSEKGIEISRRTVAKYRESMNILSSCKRRRY